MNKFDFPAFFKLFYPVEDRKLYQYDIINILILGKSRSECVENGEDYLDDAKVSSLVTKGVLNKTYSPKILSISKKELKTRLYQTGITGIKEKLTKFICEYKNTYYISNNDALLFEEVLHSSDDPYDAVMELFQISFRHTSTILNPNNKSDNTTVQEHIPHNNQIDFFSTGTANQSFVQLVDQKYAGNYNGYMFSQNPNSSELIHFEWILTTNGYLSQIKMIYNEYSSNNPKKPTHTTTLTGIPYWDTHNNNIISILTSESGNYYYMMFNGQSLHEDGLEYTRGLLVTVSKSVPNFPVHQSFILFNGEIPLKNMHSIIFGLLKLVDNNIWVSEENYNDFIKKNPDIENIFKTENLISESDKKTYYKINEEKLLASISKNKKSQIIIDALLSLRSKSDNNERITYQDSNPYSSFIKLLLTEE